MRLTAGVLVFVWQCATLVACKRTADGQQGIVFDKATEPRESRYDNGQIKERSHVAKDAAGSYVKHGPYEFFYRNGQKGEEGAFADDQKVGTWTSWHENGKLESKRTFKAGLLDGEASAYDSDGVITLRREWRAGTSQGRLALYQKGKLLVQGQYANGEADGTWTVSDSAGAKLGDVQLAGGKYMGKVKNAVQPTSPSADSSCEGVVGLRLGTSTYADAKLGFLDRGIVPPESTQPSQATGGPVIILDSPAEVGMEHVKRGFLVFGKDGILVAVTLVMPKDRPTKYGPGFGGYFKLAKENLTDKFKLVEQRIPFVGNSFAKFHSPACIVTLDAPHLSFDMTVNYWLKGHENAVVPTSN